MFPLGCWQQLALCIQHLASSARSGASKPPGHQVRPHVRAETASATRRHADYSIQRSAPEASPLRGEVPYILHTHQVSTFQQYRLLAPAKQPRVEGDFVFTTLYQCCDARLFEDISFHWRGLPSHRRLWNYFQPKSFLPHTAFQDQWGESWTLQLALPNCFSRSWKTSATRLSAPYSLRKQRKICREQAFDFRFGVKSSLIFGQPCK